MNKKGSQFSSCFLLLLFVLTPVTNLIGHNKGQEESSIQEFFPIHSEELYPMSLTPEGKYHLEVNMTIQKVFVGFDPATLDLPLIESYFDTSYEVIPQIDEFDFTINYTITYDYVVADQSYYNSLINYATINSQFTNTSKINETALALQHADAIPRSIFLDQEGYAINASLVDDWIETNPYAAPPSNGYRFYILNFSSMDASDHSIEHWFEFDNTDIDSNQTISWFRLEWDNDLNPDVKFPYPGFDSKYGKTYILDPSAYQWYSKWVSIYGTGTLPVDPHSYVTKDLDDIQRENDLVANKVILAYYLYQWIYEIIDLMISDGSLGNERYRDSDSVSLQTLILNGDDKPLDDIKWITSEERVYNELNGPMPFIDWQIDITYDNLTNFPEIEQAFHDSLIANVSNFWVIHSSLIWEYLHHRRHKFFDLDAADQVITAIILVRSDMVMDVGGMNFTGLGGDSNVVVLKSRERYFESDEVTPRSGITGVLVHEVGHNLGFGHPHGPGAYCRGTMTYYNTRHEFNQFYINILRRGQVEMRYCEVLLDFIKDKQRYGINSPISAINYLHEDIKVLLDETILFHNQMDYLSAADSINLAREKIDELQALRELHYGRIRNVGKNTVGMSESVFVENDIAFMLSGQQLLLFDVSTPASPILISSLELPYYAMDVYVKDDLAYLSQIDYGFSIIDVSDSANPVLLSTVTDIGYVTDIHVNGDFAYVSRPSAGDFDYAIRVYDITNPSNPIYMNKLCYGQGVRRLVTNDTHLYTAYSGEFLNGTRYSSIKIFNIEDPYLIWQTGEFYEPERSITFELFISGSFLYAGQVTGSGNYLNIYNVASPSNPTFVNQFSVEGVIIDLHVVDSTYAYLATNEVGLIIVNTVTLTELSRLDTDCYLWGVYVSSDHAYLADLGSLKVVDVSNPTSPTVISTIESTPVTSSTVVIKDDYAIVGDTTKGFAIYDISDKTNPINVNYTQISDGVIDLEINGDYLYVLGLPFYFHVYDISNPVNPIEVGNYNCTTTVFGLTIQGSHAFIGTKDRLRIVDIIDKANPSEIGGLDTLPYIYDIAIDGNFAYLSCEADGLEIIDISVISNPVLVYDLNIEENAYAITLLGNYAVIGHSSGMTTVDISNPNMPFIVYDYNMFDNGISKFEKYDDLLFAATFDFGIHVYNISNPTRPIEIGYNDSIVYAQDVTYDEGVLYVGNYKSGLWIYDHDLDFDLLYSYDEIIFGSDPFMYDTDGDGFSDYEEWLHGTDPRDPNDYPGKSRNILIGSLIIAVTYSFGFTIMTLVFIRRRK